MDDENPIIPDPNDDKNDGFFSPTRDEVRLSEDNDPPAANADDVPAPSIPKDYPTTDDSVDPDEAYDEGLAHAAGIGTQEIKATHVTPVELDHEDTDDKR